MSPLHPDEKKRLVDVAAKAFPAKARKTLESELDELQTLNSLQFAQEGALSLKDQKRMDDLHRQFYPKCGS